MSGQETLPFGEVLNSIFTSDPLPIHLLYRLSDLSDSALEQFIAGWQSVPEDRRRIIVRHLADLSEVNFVVDFLAVFSHCFGDASAQVRIAALDGVWDSDNAALIPPVLSLLQTDEEPEVRAAAASTLANFIVIGEWGQLPKSVSSSVVEALLAEYDKEGVLSVVKRAAVEALGSSSHPRVPTMISDAYESDDPDMQLSALFAMGGSADKRWLPIILDEMESYSDDMRAAAAHAAGAMNDRSAVPELAALTSDEELGVAIAAVHALGQLGGDHAGQILMRMSEDPEYERLHEAIDEALEELEWLDGTYDYLTPADDDEFEED